MNPSNFLLAEGIISPKYVRQAVDARKRREGLVKTLLSQRHLPDEGWDDSTIELFIQDLALMDSNNFVDNVGMGEREGRIFSTMVAKRHYNLSHGVGRSGDLLSEQPKASGSSLLSRICHMATLHVLKVAGLEEVSSCVVLPAATGMAITLSLAAIRAQRPGATKVIWPRIDQKTCLKAIVSAGCTPVVIENVLEGDELRTDVAAVVREMEEDPDGVVCVISTTSCFAPRVPERVCEVAEACKARSIPHLVNNAYGTQCAATMKELTRACRRGRVDGIVQSTDKNFLVPVGGSVLACAGSAESNRTLVNRVSEAYPGRASNAAVLDLTITFLSMGRRGYEALLAERRTLFSYALESAEIIAASHGERVLKTPHNSISMAITLGSFVLPDRGGSVEELSNLGGMLFARCCSGTRVVDCNKVQSVAGVEFRGYGSHSDSYPSTYLAFACAIGCRKEDVDVFMSRLHDTLKAFRKRLAKKLKAPGVQEQEA